MEQSMQVLEWQEQPAKRATTAAKVEEVLRVLRRRLPYAVPADVPGTIRATSDEN